MIPPVLADTKNQTRRLRGLKRFNVAPDEWRYEGEFEPGMHRMVHLETGEVVEIRSPYGTAGTRLWVRETFSALHGCVEYRADRKGVSDALPWSHIYDETTRWKPSIFMPRGASRTNLGVISVRLERLNNISEADAIAEGCALNERGWFSVQGLVLNGRLLMFTTARECYRYLWNFINGPGSVEKNPWVFVVTFRRISA
jgi:hypothetical protein